MQPWPELASHARVVHMPRSGLSLFTYDRGESEAAPALLIHGLGDEADTWRYILPALANERRVIAVDLPGFGRSDKPERSYTLEFFCDTLLELLETLQIERLVLVGHSLGAAIAQAMALEISPRLERLVLVGGGLAARASKLDLATLLFLVPGLGEWQYNRLRKDPQAAYRSLQPYYNDLEALPQAERDFLFERVNQRVWSDGQRRAFLSALRSLARRLPSLQRKLPVRLAKLETPTLVIWGEADRMNSVENGRLLVSLQPGARLVIIPGAGHNLQQENPQAVVAAISG